MSRKRMYLRCLTKSWLAAKAFAALAVLVLVSGCGTASHLDLSLKTNAGLRARLSGDPVPVTIGVDEFIDLRPQSHGSDNKKYYSFFPGVLWVNIGTNLPEIYTAFTPFRTRALTSGVAEAVAHAIRQSGLCRKIVFLPVDPYAKVDYRLEGILRRTQVDERGYYYGFLMYAWILRLMGLPYVRYNVFLEVDLRLRSMQSNKIIWETKIAGCRTGKYHNVYSLTRGKEGKHCIAYYLSDILGAKLPAVLRDMKAALAAIAGPITAVEESKSREVEK